MSRGAILNSFIIKKIAVLGFIILLFFSLFGSFINLDYSLSEFDELSDFRFTEKQIIYGYGINRNNVFEMALARLNEQSWIIGYGWGNTERNKIAWGITSHPEIADYHNLYYSMPMIFGWIGVLIIIFLLFQTEIKLLIFKDNSLDPDGGCFTQDFVFSYNVRTYC